MMRFAAGASYGLQRSSRFCELTSEASCLFFFFQILTLYSTSLLTLAILQAYLTTHDPTAPWTPSRTCELPGPPGNSPPPARHGPHHALNRNRGATASWWLADPVDAVHARTPCARPCPPHDPTAPWTPSRTSELPVPGGDSPPPARHVRCLRFLCALHSGVCSHPKPLLPSG